MGIIWQVALSNAVLVAAGTPIVWLVGRYARRPALTHGLAVILLLKLITPPLWRVPVSWPEETPASTAPIEQRIAGSAISQAAVVPRNWAPASDLQGSPGSMIIESSPAPVSDPPSVVATPSIPAVARFDAAQTLRRSLPMAIWIWAAGSALCALLAILRIVRFTRALRFATRARNVQPRADMLARRLGLRHSPAVWFVPAFVSPMLWSLGGHPRLLLPQGLWDRLDIPGRDTILLHELAHWRRGDHWVRWIELLATCLYWWHPACWWARRELREAEEQCCDAWVLWAMPGVFKNYANALLEAVEFASIGADRPSARAAVPALASRMGQFVHLRRRLTMLKHGNIARALSWGGLAGVMTLGSIVLPLAPTWGQEQPAPINPQAQPAGSADNVKEAAPLPQSTPSTITSDPRAQQQQAQEQLELAQARMTIAQLQQALQAANARLAQLEARGGQAAGPLSEPMGAGRTANPFVPLANAAPAVAPVAPEPERTVSPPQAEHFWRAEPQSGPAISNSTPSGSIVGVAPAATTPPNPAYSQDYRVIIRDPATGAIKEIQTSALTKSVLGAASTSESERLDRIEAQLRMLMDEIAVLRQRPAAGTALPTPAPATR